jgi:uncharacterized protein YecE (DUF72 family)
LPPSFSYDRDLANFEAFLEMMPRGYDFAAEFRHKSWMRSETWKLLEKHNIAYCVVDEPLLPQEVHLTADFSLISGGMEEVRSLGTIIITARKS